MFAIACTEPPPLLVEPVGKPLVTRESGKTEIVASFLAFDDVANNELPSPLAAEELLFTHSIDGVEVDLESIPAAKDLPRSSDLHLTFVLDTSYSMVASDSYDRMLRQAAATHSNLAAEWRDRDGDFTFDLFWFRDWVYRAEPGWSTSQYSSIPRPGPGSFTRLYGAADAALDSMRAAYSDGVAAGERDRHVLVLFTDGRDNFSAESNREYLPDAAECPPSGTGGCITSAGGRFQMLYSDPADLSTVTDGIVAHPNAQVHVLGLGKDSHVGIDAGALGEIARVGRGRLITDETDVDALFESLFDLFVREIVVGAIVPNAAGPHQYSIGIRRPSESDPAARCEFSFDTSKDPIEVSELVCTSLER